MKGLIELVVGAAGTLVLTSHSGGSRLWKFFLGCQPLFLMSRHKDAFSDTRHRQAIVMGLLHCVSSFSAAEGSMIVKTGVSFCQHRDLRCSFSL